MTSTTSVLENIKAPKALQTGVNGGFVLRQTLEVENGAPVFAPSSDALENAMLQESAKQTAKETR